MYCWMRNVVFSQHFRPRSEDSDGYTAIFGVSVSSAIFQKRLYSSIGDIDGVLSIADDILVFGVGDSMEQAIQDHDRKQTNLLQQCQRTGINKTKLNKDKFA